MIIFFPYGDLMRLLRRPAVYSKDFITVVVITEFNEINDDWKREWPRDPTAVVHVIIKQGKNMLCNSIDLGFGNNIDIFGHQDSLNVIESSWWHGIKSTYSRIFLGLCCRRYNSSIVLRLKSKTKQSKPLPSGERKHGILKIRWCDNKIRVRFKPIN